MTLPGIPWSIWWAIIVHFVVGLVLLIEPDSARAIALSGLHHILELGVSNQELGYSLMAFSVLAAYGVLSERMYNRWVLVALLFPQYAMMFIAFLSITYVLTLEDLKSATGQPVSRLLALAVLVYALAGSICHTGTIIERYFVRWNQSS